MAFWVHERPHSCPQVGVGRETHPGGISLVAVTSLALHFLVCPYSQGITWYSAVQGDPPSQPLVRPTSLPSGLKLLSRGAFLLQRLPGTSLLGSPYPPTCSPRDFLA